MNIHPVKYFLYLFCITIATLTMNPIVQSQTPEDHPLVNPLIEQRADPWVYRHSDGYYYFTASVPEYDRIEIRRSMTIEGLAEVDPVVIWSKHTDGIMSQHIW